MKFVCEIPGFIHSYFVASYVVLIPLVGSILMLLFYTKVETFGMITIMSILIAIIMFVTGMGWLGTPLIIAAGFIADLIARKGGYKSFKAAALSHGVFCLWICVNYFSVIVTANDYRKNLPEGGYSAEYCDALFRAINGKTIAFLMVICVIFGVIDAFVGKAVVRKHFEKAGIV